MRHTFVLLFAALSAMATLKSANYYPGISKKELVKCTKFIKDELPLFLKQKQYYLPPQKTGLSHALETDPHTKNTFIILKGKEAFIGAGKYKVVKKALLFKKSRIVVVAHSEHKTKHKRELEITKKMHGQTGIFKTYGFGRHTKGNSRYNSIFGKIYNRGSLQSAFDNKEKFSLYEKKRIALNIMKGLEALHAQKIVHRDLGARNYLIDIPKGKPGKRAIEATIADLGRANYVKRVSYSKVQGNTSYTAPEALFRYKFKGEQYYKADVYAVGCVLYQLFYGAKAPWQSVSYVKAVHTPLHTRYEQIKYRINKATWLRRQQLRKKKRSIKEQFEYLVLSMVNPDPAKRGTAAFYRQKLQKLI